MHAHPLIHTELARQRQLTLRRDSQPGGRSTGTPLHATDSAAARELAQVVAAATVGDARAWESLVARLTPVVRGVARSYRLGPADVDDVVQATWAAAFAHIGRIRCHEAIGGWLRVTAGREALRIAQRRQREIAVDEPVRAELTDDVTPETTLLAAEQRDLLDAAVARLPDRQRTLLAALKHGASYADLVRDLDIPLGSIGPTRERALARLRCDHHLVALHTAV